MLKETVFFTEDKSKESLKILKKEDKLKEEPIIQSHNIKLDENMVNVQEFKKNFLNFSGILWMYSSLKLVKLSKEQRQIISNLLHCFSTSNDCKKMALEFNNITRAEVSDIYYDSYLYFKQLDLNNLRFPNKGIDQANIFIKRLEEFYKLGNIGPEFGIDIDFSRALYVFKKLYYSDKSGILGRIPSELVDSVQGYTLTPNNLLISGLISKLNFSFIIKIFVYDLIKIMDSKRFSDSKLNNRECKLLRNELSKI